MGLNQQTKLKKIYLGEKKRIGINSFVKGKKARKYIQL
jgi:hypothetical protein